MKKLALSFCFLAAGLGNASLALANDPNVVCLRDGVQIAPQNDGSCAPGAAKIDTKAWRESGNKVVVRKNGNGVLLEPAAFDHRYTYMLVRSGDGVGAVKVSTKHECDKLAARYNGQCMTAANAKAEFVRLKSAD